MDPELLERVLPSNNLHLHFGDTGKSLHRIRGRSPTENCETRTLQADRRRFFSCPTLFGS
jgi:hypothetical protein